MKMISIKTLTTSLLTLFLLNAPAMAGVYQWTDDNGKTHFSDRPHKNSNEITIKASKPSGVGTSNNQLKRQKELLLDYQNQRLDRQKKQRANNARDTKIANKCKQLRNIILNYEEVDYLFTRDNNGKKNRLSSSEKKKQTANLQKEYDGRCDTN